jgi:peptidoglycan/LPS O-acetylase OafA/YrhL
MNKSHLLKNLSTFRAIAASVVIISHIERFKHRNNIENWYDSPFLKNTGGHIAVVLFFALSGFLITYLLLKEKNQTASVSLKKFYFRRILRVWPLYFLILTLTYFLLDYPITTTTLVMTLTLIPNIADGMMMRFEPCPPLWSIGVEEQFYLTWPWIIKYSKYVSWIILAVFIIITALPFIVLPKLTSTNSTTESIEMWTRLFENLKFNCMAAGAFFAVLLHQKSKVIDLLNRYKIIAFTFVILPFYCWFTGINFTYCTDEIYSVLFSLSIVIACSSNHIPTLDYKPFAFLGTISYGLYMYHWIILEFIFKWNFIPQENAILYNLLLYGISFICSILFAWLSYRFIEKPFLNIKNRYSVVK